MEKQQEHDLQLDPAPLDPTGKSSAVVFEEYLHYAAIQRRAEDGLTITSDPDNKGSWFSRLSAHKGTNINIDVSHALDNPIDEPASQFEAERINALRALRTASWASVFYLITTDILGPFNAPFAISQVGWVPGEDILCVRGLET